MKIKVQIGTYVNTYNSIWHIFVSKIRQNLFVEGTEDFTIPIASVFNFFPVKSVNS